MELVSIAIVRAPPIMLLAALRIIGVHYGIHASR